jgi:hypothetical protein
VAEVSQGTTVIWNGVALGELINVSVDGISSDAVEVTPRTQASRVKSFSPADIDQGTISCTVRGTAAMSSANVGLTAALSISGSNFSMSFSRAIFEKLGWSASVGELQVYSVSFKVGA